MQTKPTLTIFDTAGLSLESPVSPAGTLFTYYPSETPESFHYHDALELGYCEWGTGLFNVNGEATTFCGKCASVIYPGQVHIAQSLNEEKSLWHFIYIDLEYLFAGSEFADILFLKRLKSDNWRSYSFPSVMSYDDYPEIYNLCADIMNEAARWDKNSVPAIQGLVYALLKKHERLMTPIDENDAALLSEKMDLLRELGPTLNYMNSRYTESISIDDILQVAKMSKSNLQRKMIAVTGMAPLKYIHHLRMNYATVLLLHSRNTVTEIASAVGYNISSFNRQFLKNFGITPTEWRKRNQKKDPPNAK